MVAPAIVTSEPFVKTSLKRNTLHILFKIKLNNARAEITKLHYWNSCLSMTLISMENHLYDLLSFATSGLVTISLRYLKTNENMIVM